MSHRIVWIGAGVCTVCTVGLLACGDPEATAAPAEPVDQGSVENPPENRPVQPDASHDHPAHPATPPDKPIRAVKSTEALETRDGVSLEADLYLGAPGSDGVVLLHMIPPHYDRTSWPESFLDKAAEAGWHLCVVDRRGSGKSGGTPRDAYEGEKGKYDVEACVKRLEAHGLDQLAVFGASNGTTSALDYTAWADATEGVKKPDLLGFLTGGAYTEAQTDVVMAEDLPAVFTYSTEEREWSAALKDVSPKWVFHEYPGGAHGTKMFAAKPVVERDLLRALARTFEPAEPAEATNASTEQGK